MQRNWSKTWYSPVKIRYAFDSKFKITLKYISYKLQMLIQHYCQFTAFRNHKSGLRKHVISLK